MVEKRSKPDQYQLRFPEGMRDSLKAAANLNGRSLNAEIIARLDDVLEPDEEGSVRVWLPEELRARVVAEAIRRRTKPEHLILEAVEDAFPYVPTLSEYVDSLEQTIASDEQVADDATRQLLSAMRDLLEKNETLAERRISLPHRPVWSDDGE